MKKLNIFVSSTCYDLSQIRTNMYDFIESNGHNPILSEFFKFPVNPSKNTIDNCIDAVKQNADIFVLIVGNRYGGILESGKSITNTEFLTAKNKGIPIYAFVDKTILNIIPVWQNNKDGDYSNIVDSTKIFEFVENLRSVEKIWTFEYENAGDIISVLKTQLSYLFKNALGLYAKYDNPTNKYLEQSVSNQALNIVLEKDNNDFYELDFLCQLLIDELNKIESLKNDSKYQMLLNPIKGLYEHNDILDWMRDQMDQITKLMNSLKNLLEVALFEFFGEKGVPSDLKGLVYVAKTYARIYEQVLNWSINISCTNVPEKYKALKEYLSKLNSNLINELWEFPQNQIDHVNNLKEQVLNGEIMDEIKLVITISMNEENQRKFEAELDKMNRDQNNT